MFALDTNFYPHAEGSSNNLRQEVWLKNSLEKAKAGWKIVFGHMPLYSHGHHGFMDFLSINKFRNSIIKILCEEKVDFYLSGHDHQLEVDKHICPDGHIITAIISGAAGKSDRIYQLSFPIISDDKNLIWANGKFYKNSKLIYKNDEKNSRLCTSDSQRHQSALRIKTLPRNFSERKNACFE